MTTTTTSNVVLKLPNLSHNTVSVSVSVSVGFLCPKPLHLSSLHSNFRTKLKLPSFSISRPTHFKVSQNSITTTEEESLSNDLLIVGPGVLGRLVAQKWRHEIPGCEVYGQTMTADHHNELIQMGINPSLKWTEATHKFPNVLYCAPPSRTKDYADNVRLAALSWNGGGSFIFTSSSAPYDCNDNGPCDEDTPSVPIGRSPRVDILLNAENVVLEFGGCVLRLAGLYKADRGAHNYYLEKGIVDSRPDHILNLIHYEPLIFSGNWYMTTRKRLYPPIVYDVLFDAEDAASLLVAILKKKIRKQIFLGCDNHPLSRQEMMDLVNRSGKFSKKFDKFNVTDGPLGKRLNNTRTRQEVGWEPQYPSFAHFLSSM